MATRPHVRLVIALRGRKRGLAVLLGLLILVWGVIPLLPEETGLRFGWVYQVFLTAMVALGALLFWFLGKERIRQPTSGPGVAMSLAGVCLVTVGALVAAGVVYPQFERPRPKGAAAAEAADRGRELFLSPSIGCFRCHRIAGKGGTRGPDLTDVVASAGGRVPGLAARPYLLAKVKAGSTYRYKVPKYAPMMPPFGALATEKQLEDLVAYLMTLKRVPASVPSEESDGAVGG